MTRPLYIMVGGFLGAGKSTAVGKLAERLRNQGRRLGLITNDQGAGLVDSSLLRSQGFRVEEIAGGCFCCRFDSLREAADRLSEDPANRPEIFLAEPVGSCTDLIATVSYPLRRIYGDRFRVAPLSVLVDPLRALRVFGLEEGRAFSKNVRYVYEKQLEEADAIVLNKVDLLDEAQLVSLRQALAARFGAASAGGPRLFEVSAREERGLDAWFDFLLSDAAAREVADEVSAGHPLEIDYDLYADGEARLGWLNATLELESREAVDGNALVAELASEIARGLGENEVAHLKLTLSPRPAAGCTSSLPGEIAAVSLVRSEDAAGVAAPELGHRLSEDLRQGQLIVNLRAEGDPEALRSNFEHVFAGRSSDGLRLEHLECFRPGRPEPTHRLGARDSTGSRTGGPT